MMHAAESVAEERLLPEGQGTLAEALATRGDRMARPGGFVKQRIHETSRTLKWLLIFVIFCGSYLISVPA